jgi:hypothetical protein
LGQWAEKELFAQLGGRAAKDSPFDAAKDQLKTTAQIAAMRLGLMNYLFRLIHKDE